MNGKHNDESMNISLIIDYYSSSVIFDIFINSLQYIMINNKK